MTKTEKKRVKAATDADRALVDVRIQLRQIASMAFECGDSEAMRLIDAATGVLRAVTFYAVKKQRVEVDESK